MLRPASSCSSAHLLLMTSLCNIKLALYYYLCMYEQISLSVKIDRLPKTLSLSVLTQWDLNCGVSHLPVFTVSSLILQVSQLALGSSIWALKNLPRLFFLFNIYLLMPINAILPCPNFFNKFFPWSRFLQKLHYDKFNWRLSCLYSSSVLFSFSRA